VTIAPEIGSVDPTCTTVPFDAALRGGGLLRGQKKGSKTQKS
jgi:hypothetical protein